MHLFIYSIQIENYAPSLSLCLFFSLKIFDYDLKVIF